MSYLYNGLCYADSPAVFQAMAAACPPVTSSGQPLLCSVDSGGTGYDVQVGTGAVILVSPTLITCVPEIADATTLGGLVVGALAVSWGLKILWRAI